ncbi:MAG TPA: polymer-forming cytoskeletal protein [Candidatus Dormibacteraeota bacterium]|nr:polymer-forming cytoskeletal protein [Candidatus Dormibacteraeota bacterium]
MWRKPDGKPSSGASNTPSSIPPKTQPQPPNQNPIQNQTEPKPAAVERFTAAPVAFQPMVETLSAQASKIGPGLKIRGEISGNSDLYIEGQATGKIRITGAKVTVGPQGKVQADIEAREIAVNGEVQGNLKADAKMRLGASCNVEGALSAPSIGIDDGARFRGKVEVTRAKAASGPAAVETPAAAEAEMLGVAAHAEKE